MTLRDASDSNVPFLDTVWPFASDAQPPRPSAPAPKSRPKARPKAKVNYRSANRPGTERRQRAILSLLALAPVGFTVRDVGGALGCSRQLALYHVKKLAAAGRLTMVLQPCDWNGGLQFEVWDTGALARTFAARVATRRAA